MQSFFDKFVYKPMRQNITFCNFNCYNLYVVDSASDDLVICLCFPNSHSLIEVKNIKFQLTKKEGFLDNELVVEI